MKRRLLDLLVCSLDKTPLELVAWETTPAVLSEDDIKRIVEIGHDVSAFSDDIRTGVLINRVRRTFYPIYRGIPRLLVFPTKLTREFAKVYAERLTRELPGFHLPHETPPPGEENVLRSFSKEWLSYYWNPRAYWNLNAQDMCRSMRFLLDLDRRPVKRKLILEMGIGIGGFADYVSRSEESELVGVDLGYAVDAAYRNFGQNPLLHIIQASVFSPPFRESTFDFVYSHGVIMATYSTKTAFNELARLPRIGGRLYIWVYSPYEEERTWKRRMLMKMERLIRPAVSRLPEILQTVALLPLIPLYLIHQNLHVKRGGSAYAAYSWREAMHAARDRFTPLYATRHTEEEVCDWFRAAGYSQLQCISRREIPDFVPKEFVTAAAVDGIRHGI
jgi:uncharacterized protein YbaR (Trm112 family)